MWPTRSRASLRVTAEQNQRLDRVGSQPGRPSRYGWVVWTWYGFERAWDPYSGPLGGQKSVLHYQGCEKLSQNGQELIRSRRATGRPARGPRESMSEDTQGMLYLDTSAVRALVRES